MADLLLIDRRLIARGVERTSTMRFVLWLVPWVALSLCWNLCGWAVPVLRPEPDPHGQSLRLRNVDLSGSGNDRHGRRRLLHRLPRLHPQAGRSQTHPEQRGRRGPDLLQRRGGGLDGGRWAAPARLVHFLAPEHPLDAHRGHLLYYLLSVRAHSGIPARALAKPAVAQGAVLPGV